MSRNFRARFKARPSWALTQYEYTGASPAALARVASPGAVILGGANAVRSMSCWWRGPESFRLMSTRSGIWPTGWFMGHNQLSMRDDTGKQLIVTGALPTDDPAWTRWHNTIWTHDGSKTLAGCKFYFDGAAVTASVFSDTGPGNAVPTASLDFGGTWNGADWSNDGTYLRNAAYFNYVLTAGDAALIWNGGRMSDAPIGGGLSGANAYGFWRLNEGTGTTLTDAGTTPHNGALTGYSGLDKYRRAGP